MRSLDPQSPWRHALVREIAVILAIKLILLLAIKAIWFDAPTVPVEGAARTAAHLFDSPLPPSATEEKPE